MQAIILINKAGGKASKDDLIGETVEAGLRKVGIAGSVELTDGAGVAARAKEAAASGCPLVIAGGGDGTLSAVAGALAGTQTALGILPLGTLNHFARDLGIPFDLDEAAATIARGVERRVDVADLNGRVFINNSSVGLYSSMVVDREAQQRRLGRSKWAALPIAAVRALVRFRHYRITLCAEGDRVPINTALLFVGNNEYDVALRSAGRRARLDGGELCAFVLRSSGRLGLFASVVRSLFGRSRPDDMIRLPAIEELRVECHHRRLTVSLDGEAVPMQSPLTYRIRKGALAVMAPAPA